MTKVVMEYLQANGRYRRGKADTETQWPNFLINHSDNQAHSLVESPVFPLERNPRRFNTWEEFLAATPPVVAHYPDKLLCVCEDQNIWPISNQMMPDIQDRQMQFKEFEADAEQNAVASATRESSNSGLMGAWSVASLMIFCIVSAVIVLIALQSKVGQDLLDGIPGVSGLPGELSPFLFGMTLFLPFKKGQREKSEPKPETRRERARRLKDWETVRLFDEMVGYAWSASLPLQVIVANLPTSCRYTQELGMARRIAGAVWGGAVLLFTLMVTTALGWNLIPSIIVPVLVAPLGMLFGFLKGYGVFMLVPVWVARREFARGSDPQDDVNYAINYDALPLIVPETHTMLTGVPMEIAVSERRQMAEQAARATQETRGGDRNGTAAVGVMDRLNLAVAYTPRIWRASALYEILKARAIRKKMRGPVGKGDKLQKISMAGMALGSIGLLILALLLLG